MYELSIFCNISYRNRKQKNLSLRKKTALQWLCYYKKWSRLDLFVMHFKKLKTDIDNAIMELENNFCVKNDLSKEIPKMMRRGEQWKYTMHVNFYSFITKGIG